jgi:polyprenyl P-hydroxybenzoate/phenylacrylic acid decarboxylase-like protein
MNTLVSYAVAGALLLAVTAYSTAGGTDYGAGIWDLLAGRFRHPAEVRELIDHAMAPVWEANNVWLVFAAVICWTGFPLLYESVFLSLYPLFALALLALILRGAFFAFRKVATSSSSRLLASRVFGISSLLAPFSFAAALGAIASGTMSNLIQRAASVALKEERKLVLMPRETPLSTIHLEGMLTVRRAGATVLFLAPGFYHGWERVDQLVDFVVGRCLDQLGLENTLVPEWGS